MKKKGPVSGVMTTDRGEYCQFCHKLVALSSSVRLTRTVSVSRDTPNGKQHSHIDCVHTARFAEGYQLYAYLLTERFGKPPLDVAEFVRITATGKRSVVARFVDELRLEFAHRDSEPQTFTPASVAHLRTITANHFLTDLLVLAPRPTFLNAAAS